jgi:glycosyltransferase involved in cell wall biosynthesis
VVPAYVNAADAVLVPSEREGFGLAPLEALACDVPVLATPVGIAPVALAGVAGTLCAPFDRERWLATLLPHLERPESRIEGRARAALFDSRRMAARVACAYRELVRAGN